MVSNGKLLQELPGVSLSVSGITGMQIFRKPVNLYVISTHRDSGRGHDDITSQGVCG